MSPQKIFSLFFFLALILVHSNHIQGQEAIFSGPQIGEKLPPLPASGLTGELAGKSFDVLEKIQRKPVLMIFFHSLTRPAFGMTRALTKFAESKKEAGMQTFVIFLTDDPTKTENWASILPKQMPAGPTYCISTDGIEGPGAYGLNRNVILTVLVAKDGVVTSNTALVQPQLQADGPKILQAIVDVSGGGKVPNVAELEDLQMAKNANNRTRNADRKQEDPKFTELLRQVINRTADEATVKKAATNVEAYVAEHEQARAELARICSTIVGSGKVANYGTAAAQDVIRQWAVKYGGAKKLPSEESKSDKTRPSDNEPKRP